MDYRSLAGKAVAVGLLLLTTNPTQATPLIGTSYGTPDDATLYDINPATGQASNPRSTGVAADGQYLVTRTRTGCTHAHRQQEATHAKTDSGKSHPGHHGDPRVSVGGSG